MENDAPDVFIVQNEKREMALAIPMRRFLLDQREALSKMPGYEIALLQNKPDLWAVNTREGIWVMVGHKIFDEKQEPVCQLHPWEEDR